MYKEIFAIQLPQFYINFDQSMSSCIQSHLSNSHFMVKRTGERLVILLSLPDKETTAEHLDLLGAEIVTSK